MGSFYFLSTFEWFHTKKNLTALLLILILLPLVYILLSLIGYYFQDLFIFRRKKLPVDYAFNFKIRNEEHFISTEDGILINVLLFFSDLEKSKGMILYFHGNADNMTRWGKYAGDFTSMGYDILMFDYRSNGKSGGRASEEAFYMDAKMIWAWAHARFSPDKWILYGRSIGSAVASWLAIRTQPDLLVLETPFDELNGAGGAKFLPFRLKYGFSNKEHLKQVNSKVVIIYGSCDLTVPPRSTLKLTECLKDGDQIYKIRGGKHKTLRKFADYHDYLNNILN